MRLAALDTNIVVSAGIVRQGASAKIVMDWVLERSVQTVICPAVASEYLAAMKREKFSRYGFPPFWLGRLIDLSLWLADPAPWPLKLPDPDDEPFLALAHASGAVLVTGNVKHFPKSVRGDVEVFSPADYLARLREESPQRREQ
jgi:uncharacterized protein